MRALQQKIGHSFQNIEWLKLALTHKSHHPEHHNERLEFLGDSILGFVIAAALYRRFENLDEGRLSRLRAKLVGGAMLVKIARELSIGEYLKIGPAMRAQKISDAVLENALEAVFGAVFLDADFQTARRVILEIYQQKLNAVDPQDSQKDPKTRLQEFLQKSGRALPEYEIINRFGKSHQTIFTVRISLKDAPDHFEKKAATVQAAEQSCARSMLEKLTMAQK